MNAYHLFAIHGFLGLPSDWSGILPTNSLHAIDLFQGPVIKFHEWADKFNLSITTKKNLLIGYSMGGRLALHALLQNPSLWSGAIIISAHPGLKDSEDHEKRIVNDLKWSKRFQNEPWETLLKDWNAQEVFHGMPTFERKETQYSRKSLAEALEEWSLGKQENLKEDIEKLNLPILWIAGERDKKYVCIAESMQFCHPKSQTWIAPDCAHRVPWESPSLFLEQVKQFSKDSLNA